MGVLEKLQTIGVSFSSGCERWSDEMLEVALGIHLDHIKIQPNNSTWSLQESKTIQEEIERRRSITPIEPIEDFIWRTRDGGYDGIFERRR